MVCPVSLFNQQGSQLVCYQVFAIGDLLDLTQPWVLSRGLRYYLLARASLCLDPVFESPTVTALQAMVHALATVRTFNTLMACMV